MWHVKTALENVRRAGWVGLARCLSLWGVSEVVVVVLVACIPSLGCHPADPFCALLMRSERGDPF